MSFLIEVILSEISAQEKAIESTKDTTAKQALINKAEEKIKLLVLTSISDVISLEINSQEPKKSPLFNLLCYVIEQITGRHLVAAEFNRLHTEFKYTTDKNGILQKITALSSLFWLNSQQLAKKYLADYQNKLSSDSNVKLVSSSTTYFFYAAKELDGTIVTSDMRKDFDNKLKKEIKDVAKHGGGKGGRSS